jgi:hypothetical protein
MYLNYMNDHTKYLRKYIWKMKDPLKFKIFMWFLPKKVILTRDNIAKQNWQGNKKYFYDRDESIQHLFFDCSLARIIWRLVHMAFSITPRKILQICLVISCKVLPKQNIDKFGWEFVQYYGLYGMYKLILCLTRQELRPFCRLYIWLRIEFICGPISNWWSNSRPWISGTII